MTFSYETQIKGLCSVFLQMSQHAPTSIQAGGFTVLDAQAQGTDKQMQGRRSLQTVPSGISYPVSFRFPASGDEADRQALFADIHEGLGRLGYETHNTPLPTDRAGVLEFAQGVYLQESEGSYRLEVTMAPPYDYTQNWQMMGESAPITQPT